jgi:hypothetical protein
MMNVAREIERNGIDGCRDCVTAARDVAPQLHAETLEIAGGIAGFAGADSPLSEACGIGVFEDVTPDDAARLTRFYLERGTRPRALVSPLCSLTLTDALVNDGYRPVEYQNVFARRSDGDEVRDGRIAVTDDARAFGLASASGFLGRQADDGEALIGTIIARAATMIALEARVDGLVVATAAMDLRGEIAGLHGASTMPSARRRGWQGTFIRDRVARARELGARYVYGVADVGSASDRNFRRAGFDVLYTRTLWERPGGRFVDGSSVK